MPKILRITTSILQSNHCLRILPVQFPYDITALLIRMLRHSASVHQENICSLCPWHSLEALFQELSFICGCLCIVELASQGYAKDKIQITGGYWFSLGFAVFLISEISFINSRERFSPEVSIKTENFGFSKIAFTNLEKSGWSKGSPHNEREITALSEKLLAFSKNFWKFEK